MTAITLIILIYFAVLVGLTLFFSVKESQLWKSTLIVLVVSLFSLALWFPGENGYTPKDRLIPGLDLKGGTTLVYDVKVPVDSDAERVIDETIAILSKRVDPSGTRNLVWRQVAGNRLEVQMPLPDPETSRRRKTYQETKQAVIKGNISEQELDAKLRGGGEQREADLRTLAGSNAELANTLDELTKAYDVLSAAAEANQAAQEAYDNAEAAIKALPATATEAESEKARALADDLRKELQDIALTYLDAKDSYDAAKKAVLNQNITEFELDRIEELPMPANPDAEGVINQRRDAANELIAQRPNKKDAINAWYDAYAAYESKKGQLDDPEDLIKLLQGSGVLEFRIVPRIDDPGLDVPSYREQLAELGPRAGRDKAWVWCVIDDMSQYVEGAESLKAVQEDPKATLPVKATLRSFNATRTVITFCWATSRAWQ